MSIADELESLIKVTHFEDLSEYEGLMKNNDQVLYENNTNRMYDTGCYTRDEYIRIYEYIKKKRGVDITAIMPRRRSKTSLQKYGITQTDYDNMLKEQDNKCLICGSVFHDIDNYPCIDRCHSKGNIRGLLCSTCNSGLGFFKEKEKNLLKAIHYLRGDYDEC